MALDEPSWSDADTVSPTVDPVAAPSATVFASLSESAGTETSNSSSSVMVTVTVIVSVVAVSVTERTTTQVLASLPVPQPGASKFGAFVKVRAPVAPTIEKRSWSTDVASSFAATIE